MYKGRVISINDPEKRGRVKIKCPKLYKNNIKGWCEVLKGQSNISSNYKVGDYVWAILEENNINKPVVVGVWYPIDNYPLDDTEDIKIARGNANISIKKDDTIILSSGSSSITITNSGITIVTPTDTYNY